MSAMTRTAEATDAQALRAARTALLARRGREERRALPGIPVLVCSCGDERYGLPLDAVAQVLPARACTPVPGAPPALLGVIALSGAVVGVLGLGRALGRSGAAPEDGHFVTLRGGSAPLALAVDRVLGVGSAPSPAAPAEAGFGAGPVSGYVAAGTDGSGDFVLVDLPRLLRRYRP